MRYIYASTEKNINRLYSHYRYVERFDESNNQWHAVANMKCRRRRFALAEFDGKLYAFGGFDDSSGELDSAECYDPDLNTWELVSPMSSRRCDLSASVLSGKFKYVVKYSHNRV